VEGPQLPPADSDAPENEASDPDNRLLVRGCVAGGEYTGKTPT
jgi:hypothetical protein